MLFHLAGGEVYLRMLLVQPAFLDTQGELSFRNSKKSLTKAKQDKQIIFNEGRRESSWRMNREKCSASSGNNIFPTIIKKVWHCLKLETVSLILKNRHGEPGLPVEFARQVGKSLEPVTW